MTSRTCCQDRKNFAGITSLRDDSNVKHKKNIAMMIIVLAFCDSGEKKYIYLVKATSHMSVLHTLDFLL
jgi:hypothetical protein